MADPTTEPKPTSGVLGRGSYSESLRIGAILRKETVGGILLVITAAAAIIWANSPASESYFALRDFTFGYEPWHLELSLGAWAADGLLAVFFFLVGLELKREFVAGDLRSPAKAIVPVAAAIGGVAVPALVYVGINIFSPDTLRGWAIPTATDIAFAVAVLAIVGSHLPSALRIFLLTLAVVTEKQKAIDAGHTIGEVLTTNDLVKSENCYFAATGITDGDLLSGVRYDRDRILTRSIVMRSKSGTVRFVDGEHQASKWENYSRQ